MNPPFIPDEEAELLGDIEAERRAALKDIHEAYEPALEPLPRLKEELARLQSADFAKWSEAPDKKDTSFGPLKALLDEIRALGVHPLGCSGRTLKAAKTELRTKTKEIKDQIRERTAEVKRAVKELSNLDDERTERLAEANAHADRQVALVKEAAADLARICADPEEAKRYFAVAERPETEENEFNLNLPRYVDTFPPEEEIPLTKAIEDLTTAKQAVDSSVSELNRMLAGISKK